ncbi:hypothetical protein C8J57DRAFT_1320792 [Mycena rebaudengoi]|nr:hypothetical protein C8J57DRAFT_1320792 [Mycena rebaudengoi]
MVQARVEPLSSWSFMAMWATFLRRKVFVVPLLISIMVGAFAMCYDWWLGDFIQLSLLAIYFLLFIPSARYLQSVPVWQPSNMHSMHLVLHCQLAIVLSFMNSSRTWGVSTPREEIYALFVFILRGIAIIWATTWTFLSCIILSNRTDILTRKTRSATYCNLQNHIRKSGFGWFVWLVQPIPFPDAHLPVASLYPAAPSLIADV